MQLNCQSMDGRVELETDNGFYIQGVVVNVFDRKDPLCDDPSAPKTDRPLITLRFENDCRKQETFPMEKIRFPPLKALNSPLLRGRRQRVVFRESDEVEVLATGKDGKEKGIFRAVIKDIKGDFYYVSYLLDKSVVLNNNLDEVIPKDRIRAINTNSPLKSNPFFKLFIEVPKELIDFNRQLVGRPETHRHFKTALSLFAVSYDELKNSLLCIGLADTERTYRFEMTRKRAMLLSEMHFRSIRQEFEMRGQLDLLAKQLNHSDEVIKHENGFEIFVKVDNHLVGMAIGAKGANLKRVLKVPGIISIDQSEGVFRVIATSRDSCLAAKDMLQFQERVKNIPSDIVSHVIGRHGQYLNELYQKSRISNIIIKDQMRNTTNDKFIEFVLIGTRETIENAVLILDFTVNCIQENMEIDRKLGHKKPPKRH